MANSTFKPYIKRGGAQLWQSMSTGKQRHYPALDFTWTQVIDVSLVAGYVGAVALDSSSPQEIDLHTAFPANLFPANVLMDGCKINLITAFSGGSVSACTALVGDTGDPNGLLTSTNIFTGATTGWIETTGAAQHAKRLETAFIPTLTLTTTTDTPDGLTAGKLEIVIRFSPLPALV